MVKILAALGTVMTLSAMTAQASFLNDNAHYLMADAPTMDEAHIKYYMAGARGCLNGFYHGFYGNDSESISTECLGQTTYTHLNQFFTLIQSGKINDLFKSFGQLYQTSYDI